MNKSWIQRLASDIEAKYGKEAKERIFGDTSNVKGKEATALWFDNMTTGMDSLNDKEFLRQMMARRCPCGGDYRTEGQAFKEFYDKSKTLEEFVDAIRVYWAKKWQGAEDIAELRGNALYLTKRPGKGRVHGSYGKGCHCSLAKYTEKIVSDIFCHCCTIGHTGKSFQYAFGGDIKMEFVESIICGGKGCTMAVHLPEKQEG